MRLEGDIKIKKTPFVIRFLCIVCVLFFSNSASVKPCCEWKKEEKEVFSFYQETSR